jgi:hypothetical protein
MRILVLFIILLTGCYEQSKSREGATYSWFCLNGVMYLKEGHGVTVMLDKDSKIIPCKGKANVCEEQQ